MKDMKRYRDIRIWLIPLITLATMLTGCDATKTVRAAAQISADHSEEARDPSRLWCNEHSIYEDECFICHPELASKQTLNLVQDAQGDATRDPNRLWCNEHSIYEDQCLICHPELANQKPHAEATAAGSLMCNEHGVLEKECGICHPELLPGLPIGKGLKIRFSSDASVIKAGVELGHSQSASSNVTPDLLGQLSFDRNKLAVITPLGKGVLREIFVDVGDFVQAGQLLATVSSPAIAKAKSDYLQVLADAELRRKVYAREKGLHEEKVSAGLDFEKAKAALAASQSAIDHGLQGLMNLGLSDSEIEEVARSQSRNSNMPIRAPFTGTVVGRNAVLGTAVEPGAPLLQVADLSTMWMELSVPETQLAGVKRGTRIQARFDALPGLAFDGELTWIAFSVDERTRMVKARVELANGQHLLKQGMFGRAKPTGVSQMASLSVPEKAVQIVDGLSVVFVKLEADLFEARPIQHGAARDGHIPILSGLSPNDTIVIAGSYIMKSEFLKARLGAGCVHD
jgi:cobalt-zinc-cadmium efflux system membrane fusion protein